MISLKIENKNKGKTLKEYVDIKKKVEKPPSLNDKEMFDMSKKKKCNCKKKKKKNNNNLIFIFLLWFFSSWFWNFITRIRISWSFSS
mgnify:CR=1 FL=1